MKLSRSECLIQYTLISVWFDSEDTLLDGSMRMYTCITYEIVNRVSIASFTITRDILYIGTNILCLDRRVIVDIKISAIYDPKNNIFVDLLNVSHIKCAKF